MSSSKTIMSTLHKPKVFAIVVLSQFISTFGSRLSGFGMGVWVYQETGSKAQFGITMLLQVLPVLFMSFWAGIIVDRWDRRRVLILSDLGAALGTVAVMSLILIGQLQVWHIYLALFFNSIFGAIHEPAFSASITLLVSKEHLGRANGIVDTGNSIGQLIGPTLAGLLMVEFGLESLLLIDLGTCLSAIVMLLAVQIPRPETTEAKRAKRRPLLREALYGLTYIKASAGLLALFVFQNIQFLLVQMARVLLTPLVLDLSTADVLGMIMSVSALGGIAGGLVMSIWGGPKRRIHGAVGSAFLIGAGIVLLGLRPSVVLIAVSIIFLLFLTPIQTSSRQALWQSKIAPEAQGRVFAFHQLGRSFVLAIAYSVSGSLADGVFEPLLVAGGPLAGSVGRIIGVGPGRGVGLFYICQGVLLILATIGAYFYPRLRLMEDEVADAI